MELSPVLQSIYSTNWNGTPQPPPQALRFSYRGECEWLMTKREGPWKGVLLPAFLCAQMFIERETSGYEAGTPQDPLWYQKKIISRQWLVIGFYAMKTYKAFLLGDNLDSRAIPSSSLQRKTEDEALRGQNRKEAWIREWFSTFGWLFDL